MHSSMCFMQDFQWLCDSSANLSGENFLEKQSQWNQLEKREGCMFCHFQWENGCLIFLGMLPLNHFEDLSTEKGNPYHDRFPCVPASNYKFVLNHLSGVLERVLVPGVERLGAWCLHHRSQGIVKHVTSSLSLTQFSHLHNGNEAQPYCLHLVLSIVYTETKEQRLLNKWGIFLYWFLSCNNMTPRAGWKALLGVFIHNCLQPFSLT